MVARGSRPLKEALCYEDFIVMQVVNLCKSKLVEAVPFFKFSYVFPSFQPKNTCR